MGAWGRGAGQRSRPRASCLGTRRRVTPRACHALPSCGRSAATLRKGHATSWHGQESSESVVCESARQSVCRLRGTLHACAVCRLRVCRPPGRLHPPWSDTPSLFCVLPNSAFSATCTGRLHPPCLRLACGQSERDVPCLAAPTQRRHGSQAMPATWPPSRHARPPPGATRGSIRQIRSQPIRPDSIRVRSHSSLLPISPDHASTTRLTIRSPHCTRAGSDGRKAGSLVAERLRAASAFRLVVIESERVAVAVAVAVSGKGMGGDKVA